MGSLLEEMAKPLDALKLRKALLIMLSSDQAGEIMAASALAQKLLKTAEKDIHWLVDKLVDEAEQRRRAKPPPEPRWQSAEPAGFGMGGWRDMITICLDHLYTLRPKDQEFIQSLYDQQMRSIRWQPSPKQMEWLVNIYERILGGHY